MAEHRDYQGKPERSGGRRRIKRPPKHEPAPLTRHQRAGRDRRERERLEPAAEVLRAIASADRLALLRLLADGVRSAKELTEQLGDAWPAAAEALVAADLVLHDRYDRWALTPKRGRPAWMAVRGLIG
jgi:hypothetical protein